MMKCEKCGYSLQIEYNVCPSCGTPNPFAKAHREDMQKYSEAFNDTQKAVIERTTKTAGVMIKLIISAVLIILSIIIMALAGSTAISDKIQQNKIRAKLDDYRAEYVELEKSRDYIGLRQFIAVNRLNTASEFEDCLRVFNVCMNYDYLACYVSEVSYPEYMEYAVRDYENYCDSIIDSYDQMIYYRGKADEYGDSDEHIACMDDCIYQGKVLIQSVFKLTDEQMSDFDAVTTNERIGLLLENWPYEK